MGAASPFELADRYVQESAELSPVLATSLGIPGHDHRWGDEFSLEGHAARMSMVRRYRAAFAEHVDHPEPTQKLAARVMLGALDEDLASDEAGEHLRDLSHLGSSFQRIHSVFSDMSTDSEERWQQLCARLESIEKPYAQLRERLAVGRERGHFVAARQLESVSRQARRLAAEGSAFDELTRGTSEPSPATRARLDSAILHAKAVLDGFAQHLERDVLPSAPTADGIGEEMYRPALDRLLGLAIEPREAYAWGWEELHRIRAAMTRLSEQILPGAPLEEVTRLLDTDPARCASSPAEFLAFIAEKLEAAREQLAGLHFEVDPRIHAIDVDVAPVGTPLGAYYHPPTEDFSRPGRVRYALGDQTVIPLYHQVSTAYHEGFPGHHLQIGTAMTRADRISRAHRLLVWYPGYGEGWAMYTERLMGELGFFENPEYELGMLAKQLYRAARVVVDIGLHLGLPLDASSPMDPESPWTFERAAEFMRVYGFRTPAQANGEVMRYLGWPGQATTYKLGEREILRLREETRQRVGARFVLKDFHDSVIGSGAMRLDLLRDMLPSWLP